MKKNNKLINEIKRLNEIMGIKGSLLNESIEPILTKIAREISINSGRLGRKSSALNKAWLDLNDKTLELTARRDALDTFISKAKTELPDVYKKISRIALDDKTIKATIDNAFTSNQKKVFSSNVEKMLRRGKTDDEVINAYKNTLDKANLSPVEKAALEQRMRDEVSTLRNLLGDEIPVPKVTTDEPIRVTTDEPTPKVGDESTDGGTPKAGDESIPTGENPVDNFTSEEISNSKLSIEELTKRKMADIPNLSPEEMTALTKEPAWFDFIQKIKNNNTIPDIFKSSTDIMNQSQKIMNELLNNKNIGATSRRLLQERLNRNMLSLANYKGNKAYKDFYSWADSLFSSSKSKEVKDWWRVTKKKDGFVIMSELQKRGNWGQQIFGGLIDGFKSMSDSTKDFWVRSSQVINPIRQSKAAINGLSTLMRKKPPFTIKVATKAQKKAFRNYFWTGNRTAYSGFQKYMAENGAIAAVSRGVGQFGRGYLITTAALTVAETVLKGGFSGDDKGFEDFSSLVKFLFFEFWENVLGLKYAVPAYTIGEPVIELVAKSVWAWFSKGGDVGKIWDEWYSSHFSEVTEEVNSLLDNNPNNTNEVPTEDGIDNSLTDGEGSTPESSGEPGSLDDFRKQLGVELNQVSQDGDIYKWDLGGGVIFNYKFVNGQYVKQD